MCVTYAVQQAGSDLREITAVTANNALARAFQSWISADCGNGQHPSIGIVPLGLVHCDAAEFNPPMAGRAGAPNANILIFRDTDWPYGDGLVDVARTTLTFDTVTGQIFDADIEINSFSNLLSVAGQSVTQDLQAVLTHETGHFLGLAHSSEAGSSMSAQYALDDLAYRTLSPDDARGICALYPPQVRSSSSETSTLVEDQANSQFICPASTAPVHGFSGECGGGQDGPHRPSANASCLSIAHSPTAPRQDGNYWALAALAVVAASRRRL